MRRSNAEMRVVKGLAARDRTMSGIAGLIAALVFHLR